MVKKILLLILLVAGLFLLSGCGWWGHRGGHGYHSGSMNSQIDSNHTALMSRGNEHVL